MKAIRIRAPGGPDVLELVERDDPVAGAGEVVVRVRCAGHQPGRSAAAPRPLPRAARRPRGCPGARVRR